MPPFHYATPRPSELFLESGELKARFQGRRSLGSASREPEPFVAAAPPHARPGAVLGSGSARNAGAGAAPERLEASPGHPQHGAAGTGAVPGTQLHMRPRAAAVSAQPRTGMPRCRPGTLTGGAPGAGTRRAGRARTPSVPAGAATAPRPPGHRRRRSPPSPWSMASSFFLSTRNRSSPHSGLCRGRGGPAESSSEPGTGESVLRSLLEPGSESGCCRYPLSGSHWAAMALPGGPRRRSESHSAASPRDAICPHSRPPASSQPPPARVPAPAPPPPASASGSPPSARGPGPASAARRRPQPARSPHSISASIGPPSGRRGGAGDIPGRGPGGGGGGRRERRGRGEAAPSGRGGGRLSGRGAAPTRGTGLRLRGSGSVAPPRPPSFPRGRPCLGRARWGMSGPRVPSAARRRSLREVRRRPCGPGWCAGERWTRRVLVLENKRLITALSSPPPPSKIKKKKKINPRFPSTLIECAAKRNKLRSVHNNVCLWARIGGSICPVWPADLCTTVTSTLVVFWFWSLETQSASHEDVLQSPELGGKTTLIYTRRS